MTGACDGHERRLMPRGVKGKRLDADGMPIDGCDWTEADWADLHYGMAAIKARIAARHRPQPAVGQSSEASRGR